MREALIYFLACILGIAMVVICLLSLERTIRWFVTLAEQSAYSAGKARPKLNRDRLTESILGASFIVIFITTLTYFVRNVFLFGWK